MPTGVQSSVTLQTTPQPEAWRAFTSHAERVVSIVELPDGRVHISCFSPISMHHPDLRSALHTLADSVRIDLDNLCR
jgi:hypothetical protein